MEATVVVVWRVSAAERTAVVAESALALMAA